MFNINHCISHTINNADEATIYLFYINFQQITNTKKTCSYQLFCIHWQQAVQPCTRHQNCCGCSPMFSSRFSGCQVSNYKNNNQLVFVILIATIFAKNLLNASIFNPNVICVFFMVNYNQLKVYYCKLESTTTKTELHDKVQRYLSWEKRQYD